VAEWSLSKLSSCRSKSSTSPVTYGDATPDDSVCVISFVSSNIYNDQHTRQTRAKHGQVPPPSNFCFVVHSLQKSAVFRGANGSKRCTNNSPNEPKYAIFKQKNFRDSPFSKSQTIPHPILPLQPQISSLALTPDLGQ